MKLMKLIKLILGIILDLIGSKIKPVKIKTTIVVNHNYIIHEGALDKSINFLNDNREAYYRGKQKWLGGDYYGKEYNNISYYKKGDRHYAVKRKYDKGIYKYVTSDMIPEKKYNKIKGHYSTYCNIATAVFCNNFNMRNGNFAYYKGKQLSANAICKYLKAGKFNTPSYKFKQCEQEESVLCAKLGGFGFTTLKKLVGSGHIATFTGERLYDLSPWIFQAGNDFGKMTLQQGFGLSNMKKLKYWVMVKHEISDKK